MPSSTSSSELPSEASGRLRHAAGVWAAAIVLAALVLVGIEAYWRAQGFAAEISDSKQLWSLQRDRIYASDALPVVFIGASRTAYGIDLAAWRQRYPHTRPVMLSVNGHYPLATLRDLAEDEDFHGLVICDINSEGLWTRYRDMQQAWVDFHRQRWNLNWHVHRLLLNLWQRISVLGDPERGWKPSLRRWWSGVPAQLPVPLIDAERNGLARMERIPDLPAYARWFAEDAERKMREPHPDPESFLRDLAEVSAWVHAIQARGGQVVFFEPPVAGKLIDLEFGFWDRARYWDAFAALPGIHTVQGMDIPAMRALELPDLSHVHGPDRARLTVALGQALERLGLLTPAGKLVPPERVPDAAPAEAWPAFRFEPAP